MYSLSDNILGTASLSADISYNQKEDVFKKRIGLSYLKYYPIVNFDLSLGDRRFDYEDTFSEYVPSIDDSLKFKVSEKWNELRFDFNLRLPLFDRYVVNLFIFVSAKSFFFKTSSNLHFS